MKIFPSMLACDFTKMGEEIKRISEAGADFIHMDVMDGNFVPNISFGPSIIKSLRKHTSVPFDVHLMISNPHKYIPVFVDAGSDIITFHLESNSDVMQTIEEIKKYNRKVGISIKPNTNVEALFPYLEYIDLVLIMTVEPGFGGQKFMPMQMKKTQILKEKIMNKNLNTLIEIDGGINLETIKIVKDYPVDICVSGTCIFNSSNASETIKSLKSSCKG